jgi:hypothetical protein
MSRRREEQRQRVFERLADEALIGNALAACSRLYGVEKVLWHAHADRRRLGLELETNRLEGRQIILSQIGGLDEVFRLLIGREHREGLKRL